ncbi:G patch domain-containing protein 4 [Athalia rosae]|uniref:G patch domain-containing protein 4 n=1 Tax=Athalia rosae TaxID=37344 RepID=UPI0020347EE4|nr:G patch domain-containing protein 4 [Athalia rosae]
MANFAKEQLLKYGWTEGKGLGKHESGIREAIKPKLKFDNAGIGHDTSEDFTYHWWENVFNEASKNISVNTDDRGVSMKVLDEDTLEITTKKSSVRSLKKHHKLQYGSFLKTSTLLNDGKVIDDCSEKEKQSIIPEQKIEYAQLTDDALFRACGRRTAHKGARHGLNLNGKLARIAEQEKQLLAEMSRSDKLGSGSNLQGKEPTNNFELVKSRKRTKSKRKVMKTDNESTSDVQGTLPDTLVDETNPQPSCSYTVNANAEDNLDALRPKQRTKKSKKNNGNSTIYQNGLSQSILDDNANTIEHDEDVVIPSLVQHVTRHLKSKKSRRKDKRRINNLTEQLDTTCVIDESAQISKKRKRIESQQIVNDILTTAIDSCGPSPQKFKKSSTDADYIHEADKLNTRISKKKAQKHKKKQRDKVDGITEELLSVNLDERSNK